MAGTGKTQQQRQRQIGKTGGNSRPKKYLKTKHGHMLLGDSVQAMKTMNGSSVDLIMTSPPFALVRKKDYGNESAESYLDWFRPFAEQFHRILKDTGSLVIDIGGSWIPGSPTRSLYHFKLLIMLCEEYGFNLAQEFFGGIRQNCQLQLSGLP